MEDEENDILDKAFDVRATSRLGCQSKITGDGTIEVEITRESLEAFENEHPEHRGKFVGKPPPLPMTPSEPEKTAPKG
jgi:2Fe-2S ferredoxin